jgi:hypothetical protein
MKVAQTRSGISQLLPSPSTFSKEKAEVEVFAGGDFASCTAALPDDHWALPYLVEVTSALQINPDIPAADKQRFITDTVRALASFANNQDTHACPAEGDERFADAREADEQRAAQ